MSQYLSTLGYITENGLNPFLFSARNYFSLEDRDKNFFDSSFQGMMSYTQTPLRPVSKKNLSKSYLSSPQIVIENKTGFTSTLQTASQNRTALEKHHLVMYKRMKHIAQYCFAHKNLRSDGRKGRIYLYKSEHIAFCEVPKAGCTFWKRIIRFLNKDMPSDDVATPLDISRSYAHFGPFKKTKTFNVASSQAEKNLLDMNNTFMFARDPYSRLWSAYLDKIFLPDFWSFGQNMVRFSRKDPTPLSIKCGYDVTFPEFIRFVVSRLHFDWHFSPVYTICNPCRTNFKYIGKQETFVTDAKYIINKTGIASMIGDGIFTETVENEIKSISEDYLNLVKPWTNTSCDNKTLICEKLWKVFQLNGYIGFKVPFPSSLYNITNRHILEKEFIKHAIKAHQAGKRLHYSWRKQKRQSLVEAYRGLPPEVLQEFQKAYTTDFELFGYDKQPYDIYKTAADHSNVTH